MQRTLSPAKSTVQTGLRRRIGRTNLAGESGQRLVACGPGLAPRHEDISEEGDNEKEDQEDDDLRHELLHFIAFPRAAISRITAGG